MWEFKEDTFALNVDNLVLKGQFCVCVFLIPICELHQLSAKASSHLHPRASTIIRIYIVIKYLLCSNKMTKIRYGFFADIISNYSSALPSTQQCLM